MVMLSAFVMKRQKGGGGGIDDDFDEKYLGAVLIGLNVMLAAIFVFSGAVLKLVKRTHIIYVGGVNAEGGEGRERSGTSIYDVFSGLRDSLGWRKNNRPALDPSNDQGIELGDIYSADSEQGQGTNINPLARPNLPTAVEAEAHTEASRSGGEHKRGLSINQLRLKADANARTRVWSVHHDDNGHEYFWNNVTNVTTYEKPDEAHVID
jgi:hypothetical protein